MTPPSAELLLSHLGWLRQLAARLVADAALAEDLVQESAVAVLRSAPAERANTRAWLATILRNFAKRAHRATARRRFREFGAARPEALESTDSLVQRAQTQQAVVDAVLALDEPYRSTVLLRFFEDKKPREIAALHSVAVATVDSRLQRAFAQLRTRLDERSGGRSAWTLALTPILSAPTTKAALWAGLLGMNVNLKLLVAALVVAAGLTTWWLRRAPDAVESKTAHSAPAPMSTDRGDSGGSSRGGSGPALRTPLAPTSRTTPETHAARAFTVVRGRVIDAEGRAAPGVAIVASGKDLELPETHSDAAGWFAVPVPEARSAELVAAGDDLVTVFAGAWAPPSQHEPLVVVAPALRLAGTVRDREGTPLARCGIGIVPPDDLRARLGARTEGAAQRNFVTQSDGTGAFRLAKVPSLSGATLQVLADGFVPKKLPLPAASDEHLDIVLEPFRFEGGELVGKVVDLTGAPVEGARVAMGLTSVVTNAKGTFALSLVRAGYPTEIVAAKAGHLPARFTLPPDADAKQGRREIVLTLGEPPLTIRGHVRDQDGAPREGVLVAIDDPDQLGLAGMVPIQLEYLLAGGTLPLGALRPSPHQDTPTEGDNESVNTRSIGEPDATWFYVRTGKDGAFELPGLQDRSYRVRATDPTTAITVVSGAVQAGAKDLTVALTDDGCFPRIEGRVLSLAGKPLRGVRVEQATFPFQVATRVPGGKLQARYAMEGRRTVTDAVGRFVLERVSKQNFTITFAGDDVVPVTIEASAVDAGGRCEVRLAARCHFRVALADPAEAARIEALDAQGNNVNLLRIERNSTTSNSDMELVNGKTDVLTVSETATTLALYRDGKRVRTIPLALTPGTVLEVR